ncbi:STAS domain-containing protein [Leptolyngbya sp. FACHB-261]|nr:STAS domain-containing protein [Leptolyngbya sp. FACHB-261]
MAPTIEKRLVVLQPKGRIDTTSATELQKQLDAVVSERDVTLLVDMAEVEFLDSSGLVTLVTGLKQARQMGNRLVLCSLKGPVRLIFEITQMDRVFEIFENCEAFKASAA